MGQPQNTTLLVCVLVLLGTLQSVSARGGRGGGRGRGRGGGGFVGADCETYFMNGESRRHSCERHHFCCGDCDHRSCCSDSSKELPLDKQSQCYNSEENHKRKLAEEEQWLDWRSTWQVTCGIIAGIIILMLRLFCMVRLTGDFPGNAVVATSTHPTDVTAQYPQNPTATQRCPRYQPGNPQPGYRMPSPCRGQPMASAPQTEPASAPFELPPSYQDVVGSPVVNHSGAAFRPGQQSYPIQRPVHSGYQNQPASPATAPAPAYNPDYITPSPTTY